DFQVVDRVSLTTIEIATQLSGKRLWEEPVRDYERPVEFVRVLLPQNERPRHTVDGWPVWFTRQVGRGKVVFTMLGPRAWYRPGHRGADSWELSAGRPGAVACSQAVPPAGTAGLAGPSSSAWGGGPLARPGRIVAPGSPAHRGHRPDC